MSYIQSLGAGLPLSQTVAKPKMGMRTPAAVLAVKKAATLPFATIKKFSLVKYLLIGGVAAAGLWMISKRGKTTAKKPVALAQEGI